MPRAVGLGWVQAVQRARNVGRTDVLTNVWKKSGPPMALGMEEYRVYATRPSGRIRIDEMVEGFTYNEPADSPITTGELMFREPGYRNSLFNIGRGNKIRVDVSLKGDGKFIEFFTQRITEANHTVSSGVRTFPMADDLALLQASEDDFKYKKGKAKPRGWLVHEAVRDVCKRFGVKIGKLAATKHRIKNYVRTEVDPLSVITDFYLAERTNTGRRFTMKWKKDKLNIEPLKRSAALIELGPELMEAVLRESPEEGWATAVTVRGRNEMLKGKDSKGRRRVSQKKISVKVKNAAAIKKYGYVHRIVYAPDADTPGEARALGQRHIAKKAKPQRALSLTIPMIPTLHKGDAIRLGLPEVGLKQIVYVSEVTQSVSSGSATTEASVIFTDPYVNEKELRVFETLDAAAKVRARPAPKKVTPTKPVPPRNIRRVDKPPVIGGIPTPVTP